MEQQVFDWHQTHPGHLRNTLSNTQSTGHSMSPSSLQTQLSSFKLFIQAWGGGVIVADNSYKPLKSKWHGATSWQFECSATGASCTGLCPTAGMKNKANAYRSKLQGEHASLLGMLSFCNFYNVKGGAIWVGCDNKVAVWQASGQSHKISLGHKHVDIIRAIQLMVSAFKKCDIIVTFFDIADDIQAFSTLDWPSQLNILMDEAAKEYLAWQIKANALPPPLEIAFKGWSCWVEGIKTTTDPSIPILCAVHKRLMIDYLSSPYRQQMSEAGFNMVDWDAVGNAMRNFPKLFRMWLSS
jgi:hypothetical protein